MSRDVHGARPADLDVALCYALLRLRVDVFVVEQACPYPELDGRDLDAGTWHLWTSDGDGPTAYLRLLDEGGTARIGRVCTRADARGRGLAARLVEAALERTAGRPVELAAQSHLATWYRRFGFTPNGPEVVEDGIAHLPLRRGP